MSGNNIIIVKKKKGGHGGHHGGAWKVAFADFMTAMMAFFMVMWLIAMKQDVKAAIAAYFRDPGAFESTRGGLMEGGAGILDGSSASPAKTAVQETPRQALERAAQRLRQELAKDVGLEQLGRQVEIRITNEGLRIELLDSEETMFFESGSAKLKGGTERMLGLIAKELGRLGRPVIVEGHTDSRPYTGRNAYSNWDLSADRANSARRVIEASGLSPNQIRSVRGYADRHLRIAAAPQDARNRRVSLVVPLDGKGE